jgi:hypothetical protein
VHVDPGPDHPAGRPGEPTATRVGTPAARSEPPPSGSAACCSQPPVLDPGIDVAGQPGESKPHSSRGPEPAEPENIVPAGLRWPNRTTRMRAWQVQRTVMDRPGAAAWLGTSGETGMGTESNSTDTGEGWVAEAGLGLG